MAEITIWFEYKIHLSFILSIFKWQIKNPNFSHFNFRLRENIQMRKQVTGLSFVLIFSYIMRFSKESD